ncbi:YbaB/EbfC family nucleoid-associated protein [Microtetraspora malaysiensis]|uniref:YbaB/EbfC family nucleoid-associated protein n=1 Tax=Microtetraspora malaysiensis TaxID=161358 RepID=A0ABW6SNE1_9ACTN
MYGRQFDPADLTDRSLDEVAHQHERVLAWLETAQPDLDRIVGTAETAEGQVGATVDVNGRVREVSYGPRATRAGSQVLAEQTLVAVREACADAQRQVHDLMREGMPGFDPVAADEQFQRLLTDWN